MDALTVSVRLRPISQKERSSGLRPSWGHTEKSVFQQTDQNGTCFFFDQVFGPETSNAEVYEKLMKDIVAQTMEGFHGTFITYGQSGSGKTYTTDALASLAIESIYAHIENCPDREFLVRFSYIELYNERLNDLLAVDEVPLVIREDQERNISIEGLLEEGIRSKSDALYLLAKGNERRRFAETKLNDRSSRAHCIIRIIIESKELTDVENSSIFVSHLHLVDLAGSEKAGENNGDRFREGCSINKSLLALSLVIRKLSEDQSNVHVNHRDSKLTRILQNALGGNSRTAIICTISPCSVEETLSTLRFATNAKKVKNKPHQNEVLSDAALMKKLKKEITRLNKKISEMEEGPNAQSIELAKKHQEVRNLKSLLLVSSKETKEFKEDRRRRETVCVPQMSRYNRFQPIKGLPCTPLKAVEEKSMVIDSDLQRSYVNVKQLTQHRLESPCATTSCCCHDLSFTDFEKFFVDDHTQEIIKRLKMENRELRLQLQMRESDTSNMRKDFRNNDLISHDEEPEKFEDATNVSFRLDQDQSFIIQSNITVRNRRRFQVHTPGNSRSVLVGSLETGLNSEEGSEAENLSYKSMIALDEKEDHDEVMDGSLLINQGQPVMDVSTMCLNQSLLFPKPSHIADRNEMKGNEAQSPQRLFDSVEKETEFLEQFESLVEEKLSLEQKVSELEQQLRAKSTNQVSRQSVDEYHKWSQFPSEPREQEREDSIDKMGEEKRKNEIEAEKEELRRREDDLRLQEERIERKIDLLCEKEEVIEDRLITAETKEKELEDKEADFLRLELEFNRKKRDFERHHIEKVNIKEEVRDYTLNETNSNEDDLKTADFKKVGEKQFEHMEEASMSKCDNHSLNKRTANEDNLKATEFEKLDDGLPGRKQEMEAERIALENKAAALIMQEKEIHKIKTEVETEYVKLKNMTGNVEKQEEELKKCKYEVDMEREKLREKAEDLRHLEDEINERKLDFEQKRVSLEVLENSLKNQGEMLAVEFRQRNENVDEAKQDGEKNNGSVSNQQYDEGAVLEKKLRKYIDMAKVFENQINDLQKEKDNLVKENKKYKELLSDFQNLQAHEQHEGTDNTKDQENLYLEKADLERQIEKIHAEKDFVEEEKRKLTEMKADFERQIHELQEEKDALGEKQRGMDEVSSDLERQHVELHIKDEKIKEEERRFNELKLDFEELKDELLKGKKEIMEEWQEFEKQTTEFGRLRDELDREKKSFEEEKRNLAEMQKVLFQQMDGFSQEKKDMEEERRKFCEMQKGLRGQEEQLKEKNDVLERRKDEVEVTAANVRGQKEELSRAYIVNGDSKQRSADRVEPDREKFEEDKRHMIETQNVLHQQMEDLSKEKQYMDEERRKFHEMQEDLRQQEEQLQEKKEELKSTKEELEIMAVDVRRQREEMSRECRGDGDSKPQSSLQDELEREKVKLEEEKSHVIEMQKILHQQMDDVSKEKEDMDEERRKFCEMREDLRRQKEHFEETNEELERRKAELEGMAVDVRRQREGLSRECSSEDGNSKQQPAPWDELEREKVRVEEEKSHVMEMQKILLQQMDDLSKEKKDVKEESRKFYELQEDLRRQEKQLREKNDELERRKDEVEEMAAYVRGQKEELSRAYIVDADCKQRSADRDESDREKVEEDKRHVIEMQKVLHQQMDDLSKEKKFMDEERRKFHEMQEDLRRQEEQLQEKNEVLERTKEELEEMAADVKRQREESNGESGGGDEHGDSEQQPLDENNTSKREEDLMARIAHQKYILEKGKDILSQKNRKLAECQENITTLECLVEELNEKNKQLEEKYFADIKEYEEAIQQLQTEQDRVATVKEEAENSVKMKESSEMERVNDLTRQVEILERKNSKLEIKNREDIEYYRLLFEKQKLKMRQVQDLGASYMEPAAPSSSSEDALNEELSQLKEQHCDLQAKYSADVTRYKDTIHHLKLEKEKALALAREQTNSKLILVNEDTPTNGEDQVQTLFRRVQILEREKKKLETKNQEDIEYYTLALEKYKRMLRERQDLGASYLEPPAVNSRSQTPLSNDWIHSKLKQLQDEHKNLQAKYTAEVSQYEQTIQQLREEKLKGAEAEDDSLDSSAHPTTPRSNSMEKPACSGEPSIKKNCVCR